MKGRNDKEKMENHKKACEKLKADDLTWEEVDTLIIMGYEEEDENCDEIDLSLLEDDK
jgi:hypothetical protein